MRYSSGSCFHATVTDNCLLVRAANIDLADQSVVGVRDGDETLVLHACDMQVLAKGGGVFITAPYAYLFTVEVCVVFPGAT
jgi:hypothetical protein